MADPLHHRPEARVRQGQTVDHRVLKPRGLRVRDVNRVRGLDVRRVLFKLIRDRVQRGVLFGGRELRKLTCGNPRLHRHPVDVIGDVHL